MKRKNWTGLDSTSPSYWSDKHKLKKLIKMFATANLNHLRDLLERKQNAKTR